MTVFLYSIIVVVGYLLGSVSSSILLSRGLHGKDVRSEGSGNAGATNMARTFGLKAGFLTLGCDMLKAFLATGFGWLLLKDVGLALGGMACITGHCFPVFYRFKGGKGISVGAVLGLVIDWRVFLCIVGVFLIVAFLSKKVSLGSLCAAVTITVSSVIFAVGTPRIVLAAFAMCLAIFQHRANIKRLLAGTEPDFRAAPDKEKGK